MANKNINGDVNVSFTEAQSRQSLESGESVKTLFGKLRKWLSDLKPVAFSGSYNDLTDKTMTGYTKPASTSAITASDTINEAIGKLEKGLESSGGSTGLLKCYSSNTYSKIKITFKQSSFSYMFFVQGFSTGWQGDGLSIVGGTQTAGKCFHIASTSKIENLNVEINNKIITVDTGYIRALYIPAEVIKQASLVQISDSSGYNWITIYSG